ncbi:MAG: single-stranded DNA-binding protein [Gloeotrichia echinulata HAB0833]
MTPEEKHLWLEIQQRQMLALEKISAQLERMAIALDRLSPRTAPNYQFPLELFKGFDWSSISATVEKHDQYGAAVVSWNGQQYTRRSPSNKFDPAVWFSRCVGKGEDDKNVYERLITFKPLSKTEVDPLPEKVTRLANF